MKPMLLFLALILSGCATPEQRAAQAQAEAEAQRQREIAYTRSLAAQCDAVGFQRDTDPWRQCLMQLHSQQQAQNAAMRGIILQQYLQNRAKPAPTQTVCTRDAIGTVTCNTR